MRIVSLATLAVLVSGPALAFPSCAPPVEIHDLAITRVEQNGVLVSTDGRAVKPEGILLPGGARDRAPQSFADQALAALSDLAAGHLVTANAQPPKEDRFGRVRGQLFVTEGAPVWIQQSLLERGLARVAIEPDRRECATELFAAEKEARANRLGIWSSAAYAVRPAGAVPKSDLGTFQIVQGTVTTAAVRGGRAYLNFGNDWQNDFTATIAPEDMKPFRDAGIDPASYAGKTLRVRGVVEWFHGAEIQIESPDDIEIVTDLRPAMR